LENRGPMMPLLFPLFFLSLPLPFFKQLPRLRHSARSKRDLTFFFFFFSPLSPFPPPPIAGQLLTNDVAQIFAMEKPYGGDHPFFFSFLFFFFLPPPRLRPPFTFVCTGFLLRSSRIPARDRGEVALFPFFSFFLPPLLLP